MEDHHDLSADLEKGLSAGELHAVYQPLIDVGTGAIVGAEALCRWNPPGRAPVEPSVFIPVAESSGLIHRLGRFMLDECLVAGDFWRGAGTPVELSVNVSAMQLRTGTFASYVVAQVAARGISPGALTIEITETLPVDELEGIVPRLQELRSAHVGVSLDDYGSGHASEAQLKRLPLSEVKFDRSMIQNDDLAARRTLRDAVRTSRELGLRTVVEGIETPAQWDAAQALGFDRAQGFLLGAPMAFGELDLLLAG